VTFLSLVPALAIIVGTGIEQGRSLEEMTKANLNRIVESIAELQTETVSSIEQILRTVAQLRPFRERDTQAELAIARQLLSQNTNLLNISVTDLDGRVIASPGLPAGTDLSGRLHVQRALATGDFVAGEFVTAFMGGEPAMPFSIAIRDNSASISGTLSAVFPLKSYDAVFDRLQLPDGTILGITDHQGVRLYFRPQKATNPIGEPIRSETWQAMQSGPDVGVIELAGSDGIERIYSYQRLRTPAGDPYLYVVLGIPVAAVHGPATRLLTRNTLMMLGVVVLAVFTALLLGWRVFGARLETVRQTARRIQDGELDARTGLAGTGHEIGDLAGAVDGMAARLESRVRDLEVERERVSVSLQEKDILLKEVHHRVKNNMQLITSLIHLQHATTDDINEFCASLESRVRSMMQVHELLYESSDLRTISVGELLEGLVTGANQDPTAPRIELSACDLSLPIEIAIPLSLIANELITNAMKYAVSDLEDPSIRVALECTDSSIRLAVEDDGPGFPSGVALDHTPGLGFQLVQALSMQLGAQTRLENGSGARVSVILPLPDEAVRDQEVPDEVSEPESAPRERH
jgi:two-component sensor histidine kinase